MSVIIGHYQFLDSHRSLSVIISHYQCMLRIVHYHSLSFIMNFFTHIGHYQSLSVIINFLHRIGYYKSSFGHYKCLPRISHYRSLSISKLSLNSFQGIFCLLSVDNDRCEVIIGHFQGFFLPRIGHYQLFLSVIIIFFTFHRLLSIIFWSLSIFVPCRSLSFIIKFWTRIGHYQFQNCH